MLVNTAVPLLRKKVCSSFVHDFKFKVVACSSMLSMRSKRRSLTTMNVDDYIRVQKNQKKTPDFTDHYL